MLTSKERVLAAIKREKIDKVPIDFWSTAETDSRLLKYFKISHRDELLEHVGADIVYINGPEYIGHPLACYGADISEDIWGVKRKLCFAGDGDKRQSYKCVVDSPLKDANSVEDILNYNHWPNPDHFDYSVIKAQCVNAGDKAVFFMGDRLNRIAQLKPAQYLRGMEQILLDSIINPEIFETIINKIRSFYVSYLERIFGSSAGMIDVIVTGDDFGTQHGLMISRQTWKKYIYPGFKTFIEICHSNNALVLHHTCGSVYEIIPDMIEAGLDALNPLQPDTANMNHQKIKSEFGKQISFHGGIGIQKNLPFGTPDDVDKEVKTVFDDLGFDTGYIACTAHNIQADVPTENVLAMLEAYRKYRQR